MTRSELIRTLTEKQNYVGYRETELVVKHVFETMIKALGMGERIEIRNFGSFSLRFRRPRKARNPKTGAPLTIDSKYAAHFKPGKELKDRVNAGMEQYAIVQEA